MAWRGKSGKPTHEKFERLAGASPLKARAKAQIVPKRGKRKIFCMFFAKTLDFGAVGIHNISS